MGAPTSVQQSAFGGGGGGPLTPVAEISSGTHAASAGEMIFVNLGSNDVGVDLPTAVGVDGEEIVIKSVALPGLGNECTVTPDGSETIDGQASIVFSTQNSFRRLVSDGVNWFVIGS